MPLPVAGPGCPRTTQALVPVALLLPCRILVYKKAKATRDSTRSWDLLPEWPPPRGGAPAAHTNACCWGRMSPGPVAGRLPAAHCQQTGQLCQVPSGLSCSKHGALPTPLELRRQQSSGMSPEDGDSLGFVPSYFPLSIAGRVGPRGLDTARRGTCCRQQQAGSRERLHPGPAFGRGTVPAPSLHPSELRPHLLQACILVRSRYQPGHCTCSKPARR